MCNLTFTNLCQFVWAFSNVSSTSRERGMKKVTTELMVLRSLIDTQIQLFTILVLSHNCDSFVMLEISQHFKATSLSLVIYSSSISSSAYHQSLNVLLGAYHGFRQRMVCNFFKNWSNSVKFGQLTLHTSNFVKLKNHGHWMKNPGVSAIGN